MDITRDFAKLTEKLKDSRAVAVPLRTLDSDEEIFVYGLVTKALVYAGQPQLDGTMQLVVSELLKNAEEAVLKRVYAEYFAKETDLDKPEFLRSFRIALKDDLKELRAVLQKKKPVIEFHAEIREQALFLEVRNWGSPTPGESANIQEMLLAGKSAGGLDAIGGLTREEGRGLALSAFALKHAGIEICRYSMDEIATALTVEIPVLTVTPERIAKVADILFKEIESLPAFPENVNRMLAVCNSPTASLKQVADEVGRDPGIASQIIRLANSGGFAGGRVSDINEAVKILGLSNVSGLLLQVGANQILDERYGVNEELLAHPVRVAVYSRILARKFKLAAVADQAYVAGLLHDIGKTVLIAHMKRTGSETVVQKLSNRRDRRTAINLEEISCGADHALVGQMLAEKWNFPEPLRTAIACHHAPLHAEADMRRLVFVVYLANVFADYEEGQTGFYSAEPDVLAFFNITGVTIFEMLAGALNSQFLSS